MKNIKVKFWCNAGHTEETKYIEIDETQDQDTQIQEEFVSWLDQNEDTGYEIINS